MRSTYLDLLAKYGVNSAHPGGLPLTKQILNSLSMNNSTKLVDLGCGTGNTLCYIAKTFPCKVIGVDIDERMLAQAAQNLRIQNLFVELVHANIMELPFPSNTFDIALSESVTVFTHIDKSLKEYARVLKSGGTLLAIEMTAVSLLIEKELNEIKSVYGIEQVLTSNEWEDMLRQAGFTDIQTYSVKIVPTLKINSLKMLRDFSPHLSIINRYRSRLSYRVYQCKAI